MEDAELTNILDLVRELKTEVKGLRDDLNCYRLESKEAIADLKMDLHASTATIKLDYTTRLNDMDKELSAVKTKAGLFGTLTGALTVIVYAIINYVRNAP